MISLVQRSLFLNRSIGTKILSPQHFPNQSQLYILLYDYYFGTIFGFSKS